jgi:hypothetical protein
MASACARARRTWALLGLVHLALDELIDERRDVAVPSGRAQRAQLEPQRRRVQSRFAAQIGEACERFAGLSALQRDLRLEHETRHREARHLCIGPREQRERCVVVAHVERRARADQRRHGRRLRDLQRLAGVLTGLAAAAFDQRDDRRVEAGPRALQLLATPVLSDVTRQA